MSKLIFGCGYLGMRVAARWAAGGSQVFAVTRFMEKASVLRDNGIEPFVADLMVPSTLKKLPEADTVLFAVGHDRGGGPSIRQLYVNGLRNALEHLRSGASRFIYISSTGVYGQSDESWVDELSPCEPTREGGRACWLAESLLRGHPLGQSAIVLRMAGIYGPERIPRRKELQAGLPIDAPSKGFLNLIHVEDAAGVVIAAEQQAPVPSLYCVSDGHPVVRREYFRELAALLGAAEPKFREPRCDAPASERAGASKRVSNQRMLVELTIELRYPSFREGLAAIIHAENAGWELGSAR